MLLDGFLHVDGVHHQLKLLQDLGLVAIDIAFYGLVGQQLIELTLWLRLEPPNSPNTLTFSTDPIGLNNIDF